MRIFPTSLSHQFCVHLHDRKQVVGVKGHILDEEELTVRACRQPQHSKLSLFCHILPVHILLLCAVSSEITLLRQKSPVIKIPFKNPSRLIKTYPMILIKTWTPVETEAENEHLCVFALQPWPPLQISSEKG